MKTNQTIIIAIVVLAIAGIAAYLYNERQKAASAAKPGTNVSITVPIGGTGTPKDTATVATGTRVTKAYSSTN